MTLRALLVLAWLAAPAAGQTPTDPVPTLRGRVVAAGTPIPLRRARVTIIAKGKTSQPVFADEAGMFEAPVPASPYSISVTKAGYAPMELAAPPAVDEVLTIVMARAAVVQGRVVDAAGDPGVGMAVRARRVSPGRGPAEMMTDTDDRGEFRFGGLAAGRYELRSYRGIEMTPLDDLDPLVAAAVRIERERMTSMSPATSDATFVDVSAGEEASATLVQHQHAVALPYAQVGGAVTGVLLDEFGEPGERLSVRLWMARYVDGRQLFTPVGRSRMVDDQGRYRLFHVPAGRYFVVASPDPEPEDGSTELARYLPVYYPGRFELSGASEIDVERSRESSGVDMVVPRSRGARVYGVALSASGGPLKGSVMLVPSRSTGPVATAPTYLGNGLRPSPLSARPAADGTFEIGSVPPGLYALQAAATLAHESLATMRLSDVRTLAIAMEHLDGISEFAMQRVSVTDTDVGPVTLTAVATSTLSGRITTDGPGQMVAPADFMFSAINVDPDEVPAVNGSTRREVRVDDTGRFTITGLTGRSLIVLSRAPAGWWLKSVDVGGLNAARDPVDFGSPADSRDDARIVVAPTGSTLAGRVTDIGDAASVSVVVFPVDRNLRLPGSRYLRTTAVGSDASFDLNSFPPGDYYAVAVREEDGDMTGDWEAPDTLDVLAGLAQRVTLAERDHRRIDLRLVRPTR